MDGSFGISGPQPAERCGGIAEDLVCDGGILAAPPLGQVGQLVDQLQIRRRARKQGHRQGRMAVGGQAICNTENPGIHTERIDWHDIETIN